ncbi:MAG: alpha/beta hydrolase fold domain-containing protein [Candidatus Sumerlaeota bacterium]|nr:alpha/beta hydrolase fold domain-containing protein [Candidatus Sumerlaeota bacterium]
MNRTAPPSLLAFAAFAFFAAAFSQHRAAAAPPDSSQVYKTADRELRIQFDFPEGRREGARRSALVFFYNGGWSGSGASGQFKEQAAYFAQRGMVVARADYREKDKSGTTSVKCMEDIFSALRWVRAHAADLSVDPQRVAAGGGSGSAHLALSVFYSGEIDAPDDDLSISPTPGALFLYNPDLDVIEPEMMRRVFEADAAAAQRMPPTVLFSGTLDPSNPLIQDFVARTRERGLPVEAFVGEGAPHGFFKFSPWLEKTTLKVDDVLRSIGYLTDEPRVDPPSKPKPADYDEKIAQTMSKWQARHEALQAERSKTSEEPAAAKPAQDAPASTRPAVSPTPEARPASLPAPAARPAAAFVYKTIGERKLILEVNYPGGWTPDDRRPAAVIFHGGADNPKDKSGKPYPMAEERARLGLPVAESKLNEAFKPLAEYLAQRGMVAVRVDFRSRSKDGVMPDKCIEDGLSAMRWVRKNAATLGIDPERIVAVGGSGGGMLAAGAATLGEFQAPDDDRSVSPKPNAMLLFYPMLDFLAECSMSEAFLGAINGDREYGERISPMRHWRKELPPTLVLIGTRDPMYEWLKAFVAKWKEQGAAIDIYIGEGGPHGFSQYSPYLEQTTERADEFLRSIGYLKDEPRVELPHRDKAEKLSKKGRVAGEEDDE